jgi:hypothetical protein
MHFPTMRPRIERGYFPGSLIPRPFALGARVQLHLILIWLTKKSPRPDGLGLLHLKLKTPTARQQVGVINPSYMLRWLRGEPHHPRTKYRPTKQHVNDQQPSICEGRCPCRQLSRPLWDRLTTARPASEAKRFQSSGPSSIDAFRN